MTSQPPAAPAASGDYPSGRTHRKGNPRQIAAGARPAGESTTVKKKHSTDLKQELSDGFIESVRLARDMVNDTTLPAYVRVRAMDFFAKNQGHATNVDETGRTLRDEFLELMAEIRAVPKPAKSVAAEEDEDEEVEDARFEAPSA